jgi:hypothetical protein
MSTKYLNKFRFYSSGMFNILIPRFLLRKKFDKILKETKIDKELFDRINYYNKISKKYSANDNYLRISEFMNITNIEKSTYFIDLYKYLRLFPSHHKFYHRFGDISIVLDYPGFTKSRPITENNSNSVILKLNSVRHFIFVKDYLSFKNKIDMCVYRGACYKENRKNFVRKFHTHRLCNVGQVNKDDSSTTPGWVKQKMSIREQLKYKFIISLEGNDVASNLKWIMSSNSVAVMPKPRFETWFMEGKLIPNHHYILIKDDYSDLEEKLDYYMSHQDKAEEIIRNANRYVEQFKDKNREDVISYLVMKKYFDYQMNN